MLRRRPGLDAQEPDRDCDLTPAAYFWAPCILAGLGKTLCPQKDAPKHARCRIQAHHDRMMTLAHAYALAEARLCIAALADTAATFEATVAYGHALL